MNRWGVSQGVKPQRQQKPEGHPESSLDAPLVGSTPWPAPLHFLRLFFFLLLFLFLLLLFRRLRLRLLCWSRLGCGRRSSGFLRLGSCSLLRMFVGRRGLRMRGGFRASGFLRRRRGRPIRLRLRLWPIRLRRLRMIILRPHIFRSIWLRRWRSCGTIRLRRGSRRPLVRRRRRIAGTIGWLIRRFAPGRGLSRTWRTGHGRMCDIHRRGPSRRRLLHHGPRSGRWTEGLYLAPG